VKVDGSSCEHAEEWQEPQPNNDTHDDDNVDAASSYSSMDTDQFSADVEDIFNEIDQSANYSKSSAAITNGLHDSLGTSSNLSEDTTVSIN